MVHKCLDHYFSYPWEFISFRVSEKNYVLCIIITWKKIDFFKITEDNDDDDDHYYYYQILFGKCQKLLADLQILQEIF